MSGENSWIHDQTEPCHFPLAILAWRDQGHGQKFASSVVILASIQMTIPRLRMKSVDINLQD
jgi:hypothetical protein